MAELLIRPAGIRVHLGRWERMGAFHADLDIPVSQVKLTRAVDDAWTELRGVRAPGTGWPGVIALGTRRGRFGKDFAAVYGHRPGVVVELAGAEFQRLVITTPHAESVASEIQSLIT